MGKLTQAPDLLRKYWTTFCDADGWRADYGIDYDDFRDLMEMSGLIEMRQVTSDDLESSFAHERGIVDGGYIYSLTDAGRAALEGET